MTTYRQLKQQIAELEKKAALAMKKEVGKVIESIKKQIAEFGLTAADLGLAVARRAGAKRGRAAKRVLEPKYRDPATGKTWNGHGKRPGWIVAAQDKGRLDELLIARPARARTSVQAAAKSAGRKTQKKAAPVAKPAAKKAAKKPAARAKRIATPRSAAPKPATGKTAKAVKGKAGAGAKKVAKAAKKAPVRADQPTPPAITPQSGAAS